MVWAIQLTVVLGFGPGIPHLKAEFHLFYVFLTLCGTRDGTESTLGSSLSTEPHCWPLAFEDRFVVAQTGLELVIQQP